MKHTVNIENFRNTESRNCIASSSLEQKRLLEVFKTDEHLRNFSYYEVQVKGEIVLTNATVIDAVAKYNSI